MKQASLCSAEFFAMNALQPSSPPPSHSPNRQPRPRSRRQPRRSSHQAIVAETSVKLTVNLILGIVAITALAKLIPYNLSQRQGLDELQAEVQEVEGRVVTLQADLDRQFDPQQARSVMQEQGFRVDPNQRQIVWMTQGQAASTAQQPTSDNTQQAEAQSPSIEQPQANPYPNQTAAYPGNVGAVGNR